MDFLAPFHPQLVHFPVALILVALLFDVIGRLADLEWWRKAAFALLVFGVLGAGAAVLSGEPAGERAERFSVPEQAVDAHEEAGELALWVGIAALVARIAAAIVRRGRTPVSGLAFLLLFATAALVTVAGFRGGKLVYEHGAAVTVHGQAVSGPEKPAAAEEEAEER